MASNNSSYTRLRDIAVKRIGRLEESGISVGISIPTIKQIKDENMNMDEAMARLQLFIESPTRMRDYKKLSETEKLNLEGYFKEEHEKELHRQRNRRYRERLKELSTEEMGNLKASRTLGLSVGPLRAKMFHEYLEYRFKYGDETVHYRILRYTEEFKALVSGKSRKYHTFDEMKKDFELYMFNRQLLENEAETMKGIPGKQFDDNWKRVAGIIEE